MSGTRVTTQQWLDWTILTIEGEFTLRRFASIRPVLESLWERGGVKVAVDLSQTKLIDSSAITLLISAHGKLTEQGGSLVILQPSQEISLVFSVVEFDRKIPIYQHRTIFETEVETGVR